MFHSDLQKLLFHISQNGRTDLTQPTLHYWPSATEDKRHGWNNWWEMPLDSGPNHILYTSSGSQSYSLQIKCADQPFSRGSCKNFLKSTKSTIFRNLIILIKFDYLFPPHSCWVSTSKHSCCAPFHLSPPSIWQKLCPRNTYICSHLAMTLSWLNWMLIRWLLSVQTFWWFFLFRFVFLFYLKHL